ncbi:MAG: hypothetical protein D6797_05745 [Bdellovibrio sp.]|nr:MAG: hypothetical protein D6797_05745 [Bdellovibrio sp.]
MTLSVTDALSSTATATVSVTVNAVAQLFFKTGTSSLKVGGNSTTIDIVLEGEIGKDVNITYHVVTSGLFPTTASHYTLSPGEGDSITFSTTDPVDALGRRVKSITVTSGGRRDRGKQLVLALDNPSSPFVQLQSLLGSRHVVYFTN